MNQPMVEKSNKCCSQYLGTLDNDSIHSWQICDWTRYLHLYGRNNTNGTWHQGHTEGLLVNSRTMLYTILLQHKEKQLFFFVVRFPHFSNSMNWPAKMTPMTDFGKWELFFDPMNDAYVKVHSASEHVAVDDVTVLFKGRVILKQYIPKKQVLSY